MVMADMSPEVYAQSEEGVDAMELTAKREGGASWGKEREGRGVERGGGRKRGRHKGRVERRARGRIDLSRWLRSQSRWRGF